MITNCFAVAANSTLHAPHKNNCHLCQADRISAGGSPLKMDSNTDNGEMEGMEVDPDLRARMEALMQHYLDTENDGAARENEEGRVATLAKTLPKTSMLKQMS